MSADFWAGYVSGAAGILIGNPLDLIKVRLQAGRGTVTLAVPNTVTTASPVPVHSNLSSLAKGTTAPILGYGLLNALLFVTYNRTLSLLSQTTSSPKPTNPSITSLTDIWTAGAVGGIATWIVSAPTELVKCRTQLESDGQSSWTVAKDIWRQGGLRGLYYGGGVTSVRDAVGYGFYFWSYELSKRYLITEGESDQQAALKVLLCGGLAGVVTWASIFPLDVVKTRLQTQKDARVGVECEPLLGAGCHGQYKQGETRKGAFEIAQRAYREEGARVFFRGLGVCSLRAFVVNAVQWAVYEWIIRAMKPP